jgi:nucleotide-binding universal stress UspA family protein
MIPDRIGVLVGVDASACSEEALGWAAADATCWRVPLTLAAAVDLPRLADGPMTAQALGTFQQAARARLDAAVAAARELTFGVPVRGRVLTGDPTAELLRLTARADEVVVAAGGTSLLYSLIGSASTRMAERAGCPAVVVRQRTAFGAVVVGIDNSPHSATTLEYAFGYADRHGLPLRVMHVCVFGVAAGDPEPPYPVLAELARLRAEAACATEQRVAPWTEKYPEVDAAVQVVHGAVARELVEASRAAGLVVVGTRGHGGLAGLLFGSVSHALLRYAQSPVALAR